jgi:hypothetical protein
MVWMPGLVARVEVLTWLWRVPQAQSAYGPHAAVVECTEHPHHLRSQAPSQAMEKSKHTNTKSRRHAGRLAAPCTGCVSVPDPLCRTTRA